MKSFLKRITIFTFFILFILMVINWDRISIMSYPLKIIELEGYSNIHFVPETKKLTVEKAYVISFAPKNRKTLLKLLEKYQQEKTLSSHVDSIDFSSVEGLYFKLEFYKETIRINRFTKVRSEYAGGEGLRDYMDDYIGSITYNSSNNKLKYTAVRDKGKDRKIRTVEYEYTLEEFLHSFK